MSLTSPAPIDPMEALTPKTKSLQEIFQMEKDAGDKRSPSRDSLAIAIQLAEINLADIEKYGYARDDLNADVYIPWLGKAELRRLIAFLRNDQICTALALVHESGMERGRALGQKESAGKSIPRVARDPSLRLRHFLNAARMRGVPRAQMAKWLKAGGKYCLKSMEIRQGPFKGHGFYLELPPLTKKLVEKALDGWSVKSKAGRPKGK